MVPDPIYPACEQSPGSFDCGGVYVSFQGASYGDIVVSYWPAAVRETVTFLSQWR